MLPGVNPRSPGPHGRIGTVSAQLRHNLKGAVGDMVGLAVLGLLFLIASFFKWWLLVIVPTVYCAVFFVKKRKTLRGAFSSSSENETATDRDRVFICWHFLLLAVVFTGLAVPMEGSAYACLAASLFWLITVYVAKARMDSAKLTTRFVYHLTKGSLELLTILAATLAAYSVYAWRVSTLPLGTATLFQIRSWEGQIARAHAFFEAVSLSKVQTIALIAALYIGRILEIRYGHGRKVVSHAWETTQVTLKWVNRLALVPLIAASFTFLATRSDGPSAPLEARLKEMEENCSQFRSEAAKALAAETKRQLSQRAWNEMPPPLRRALVQAEGIQKEKINLLKEIRWADGRYHLDGTQSAATQQEYSAQFEKLPDQAQQPTAAHSEKEHDADSATAGDLRDAASDASSARSAILKESTEAKGEMGEELVKSVQGFIVDSDRLIDNVGVLKVLAGRYPLLGEFLSTLNDAFNDYVYEKLKPSVDRLVREKLKASKRQVLAEVKKVSAELVQSAPLRWHSDDPAWRAEMDRTLTAEESSVRQARRQLEADATFAEKREIKRLSGEIRQHESEYQKIGEAMPEHKDLLLERVKIEAQRKSLERAPLEADPLAGFKKSPRPEEFPVGARFADLLKRMSENSSTIDLVAAMGDFRGGKVSLKPVDGTVLDQLSVLNSSCASQISEIVGKALYTADAPLRRALGREAFDRYKQEYEQKRAILDVLANPGGPHLPARFPGEPEPGIDPRKRPVEPRVEPRVEPHFVP